MHANALAAATSAVTHPAETKKPGRFPTNAPRYAAANSALLPPNQQRDGGERETRSRAEAV